MTKDQIPLKDILALVRAADGAAVVAIHDRTDRCVDIVCSDHGRFYVYAYSRAATVTEIEQLRLGAVTNAARHAANRHTPRTGREGGQQS